MSHRAIRPTILVLFAVAVAVPLLAFAQSLPVQENNEGTVTVSVTPQNLSKTGRRVAFRRSASIPI